MWFLQEDMKLSVHHFWKKKNIGNVKINKREFLVARSWLSGNDSLKLMYTQLFVLSNRSETNCMQLVSKKNSIYPLNSIPLYHIYCHMIGPRRNKLKKFHEDVCLQTIRRLTLIRLILTSESFSSFHCFQEQSVQQNLSSFHRVSFQVLHKQPSNK